MLAQERQRLDGAQRQQRRPVLLGHMQLQLQPTSREADELIDLLGRARRGARALGRARHDEVAQEAQALLFVDGRTSGASLEHLAHLGFESDLSRSRRCGSRIAIVIAVAAMVHEIVSEARECVVVIAIIVAAGVVVLHQHNRQRETSRPKQRAPPPQARVRAIDRGRVFASAISGSGR